MVCGIEQKSQRKRVQHLQFSELGYVPKSVSEHVKRIKDKSEVVRVSN